VIRRHYSVPWRVTREFARVRVGFAAYFTKFDPDFNCSHVVAEMWDSSAKRWRLVDPELDNLSIRENNIQFDVHDTPRDQFLVGGKAWQMCRAGQADPSKFGVSGFGDMKGLPFVRGNLIQDLAALNKMELLKLRPNPLATRGSLLMLAPAADAGTRRCRMPLPARPVPGALARRCTRPRRRPPAPGPRSSRQP
jgi:hypothetical protein